MITRTGLIGLCWIVNCTLAMAQTEQSNDNQTGGQLFGDWVVHCENKPNEEFNCRMAQMAIVEDTQERLLRINIRYVPRTSDTAIQFVLPLGVSLKQAPILRLDNSPEKAIELDVCLVDGCYSTFPLDAEWLENFLSMSSGVLDIKAGNGSPISIPISGKGSRAAFRAMNTFAEKLSKQN